MQNLLSGILVLIMALTGFAGSLSGVGMDQPVTAEAGVTLEGDFTAEGGTAAAVDALKGLIGDITFRFAADPAGAAQMQVLLKGSPVGTLSVQRSAEGWDVVSNLFPGTKLTLSNEALEQMMAQMGQSLGGENGLNTQIASLQEKITPELIEAISAPFQELVETIASKRGEPETGTFEVNGATYTQKVPYNMTAREMVVLGVSTIKKVLGNETVAAFVKDVTGNEISLEDIDETLEELQSAEEEKMPVLDCAEYSGEAGSCVAVIFTNDGQEISLYVTGTESGFAVDLSALGALTAHLKAGAEGLDLNVLFSSEGTTLNLSVTAASEGENAGKAQVAVDVKSGETAFSMKFNFKVTAEAPVIEIADSLKVLSLDAMMNGTASQEDLSAFQMELQGSLMSVLGNVMQSYPELGQLMNTGAPAEKQAPVEEAPVEEAPAAEVPAA